MSTTLAARTINGIELPAPGVWQIDASHSSVEFTVRHLMVAKVRGRFDDFAGSITVDEVPERSSASVTIKAASINTAEAKRDVHLRSADFLNVDEHATLEFVSDAFEQTGDRSFDLLGTLEIRGIARPVRLAVEYGGMTTDPWGNSRAVFSARTQIDREAWGLTWNQALEAGGVLVGKQVTIDIEISAVKA